MLKTLKIFLGLLEKMPGFLFTRILPVATESDIEKLGIGNVLLAYNSELKMTRVFMTVSGVTARIVTGDDRPSRFFYVLQFGDDLRHYPRPDTRFTSDDGMEPYGPNGHRNPVNRAYILPFKVSRENCEILIQDAKKRWKGLINVYGLAVKDSPFDEVVKKETVDEPA